MDDVLLRTSFIVADIDAAVAFNTRVFGWRVAHRTTLAQGEAILAIRSANPDAIHEKINATPAVIVAPPADWEVPGAQTGQIIRLRTNSLFDPKGIHLDVNLKYPDGP